ncbi:arginase family protein [Niveispirillum irakense]|uniref:arginase family protein n=1 Tax=Niveispirillum irakense TaxID=34011 RepID=UPI0003FAB5CC|nr:arginase family protein [Niveispirillum irakense]
MMRKGANWYGVVGAPTDVGHVGCGAAAGPAGLRAAGLMRRLGQVGLVADMGDVAGPAYDGAVDVSGCRSVAETASWCGAVRDRVGRVLAAGGFPIMMGGDHSLALGSIAAASAHARAQGRAFHVLWFDAHPDFNTPETSPSGNTHGLPAATACGLGHPLMLSVGAFTPLLLPAHLEQFGIRDVDPGERANLRAASVRFHEMPAVRAQGLPALVGAALARIAAAGGGHVHVSFDLDVLDPAVAPGVGTPVPGGLDLPSAEIAMRMLGASGLIGSLDLVEFAAGHDREGRTASAAERLLTGFIAARNGRRDPAMAPLDRVA